MPDLLLRPYRILDLCDAQGWFCGKLLADLGADVVKVEPPGGDPGRHTDPFACDQQSPKSGFDFLAYNTNKRSVTLDIGHPQGRTCVLDLVCRADALIETFPPGHLASLGLGWDVLHEANPRLVMASITPYGQTGPYRHHLSSDLIAMATSGFMQVTGDPDGPPMRLGNDQSRFAPALYAALGVVAALCHRDWHGGAGQHIDVSMQEALLSFILEQHPVLCWHVRHKNVTRVGRVSGLTVPAGVFPCADGWVGLGIITAPEWDVLARWLFEVTGGAEILAEGLRGGIHARAAHGDLIEAVLLDFTMRQTRAQLFREGQRRNLVVVPVNTVADVLADEGLAHANLWEELDHPAVGRLKYPVNLLGPEVPTAGRAAPLLGEANEEILCGELGLTREQVEELGAEGVIGPINRGLSLSGGTVDFHRNNFTATEQVGRRGMNSPAESPRSPLKGTPNTELQSASADFDRLSRGILFPGGRASHHRPRFPTVSPKGGNAALDGVRVVEFGPFIALPLTGRILAALSATVIKVETNKLLDQLNYIPPWGNGMGQPEYQALKRRITLDVRTPEGAAVLQRLIAVSDVFMTNFRRDALARWGIDLDALRRRHPELIIVHQSGFGAGAYERYKLYGIMAQHVCGVSTMSGEPETPPCCLNSAYSDYHTPLFQALAVLGALDRRRRTGRGTLIQGSILPSGVCTVAAALLDYQASGRLPQRRGNHDPVAVPHNVYPCRGEDEWCAVAVWNDGQWQALCRVVGHVEWVRDGRFATAGERRAHEEQLDTLIAGITREWNKRDLMETLQAAGVPAGIVAKGEDLAGDPQLRSRGLYAATTYYVPDPQRPGMEWERGPDVVAARLPLLLSETPCLNGPYRRIGEDNEYMYREILGMSADEMRRLAEQGVLV